MKAAFSTIEEKTIPLAPAPGMSVADQLHQVCPALSVVIDLFGGRHDLSPKVTSQIVIARIRQIPIGDHEILPPVIV